MELLLMVVGVPTVLLVLLVLQWLANRKRAVRAEGPRRKAEVPSFIRNPAALFVSTAVGLTLVMLFSFVFWPEVVLALISMHEFWAVAVGICLSVALIGTKPVIFTGAPTFGVLLILVLAVGGARSLLGQSGSPSRSVRTPAPQPVPPRATVPERERDAVERTPPTRAEIEEFLRDPQPPADLQRRLERGEIWNLQHVFVGEVSPDRWSSSVIIPQPPRGKYYRTDIDVIGKIEATERGRPVGRYPPPPGHRFHFGNPQRDMVIRFRSATERPSGVILWAWTQGHP